MFAPISVSLRESKIENVSSNNKVFWIYSKNLIKIFVKKNSLFMILLLVYLGNILSRLLFCFLKRSKNYLLKTSQYTYLVLRKQNNHFQLGLKVLFFQQKRKKRFRIKKLRITIYSALSNLIWNYNSLFTSANQC